MICKRILYNFLTLCIQLQFRFIYDLRFILMKFYTPRLKKPGHANTLSLWTFYLPFIHNNYGFFNINTKFAIASSVSSRETPLL